MLYYPYFSMEPHEVALVIPWNIPTYIMVSLLGNKVEGD